MNAKITASGLKYQGPKLARGEVAVAAQTEFMRP